MSQSYNNLTVSPVVTAGDEILGLTTTTQTAGTSVSGKGPVTSTVGILTLTLALDGGAPVTVSIAAKNDPHDLMLSLQTAVRAAGGTAPFTAFTSRYDDSLSKYVLASGTSGATPAVPASAVVVSGGTAAASFKLGVANQGTESTAAAPYLIYNVRYRFSFPAQGTFGGASITVDGRDMVAPTNMVELLAIANARASQFKAEVYPSLSIASASNTLNGTVAL